MKQLFLIIFGIVLIMACSNGVKKQTKEQLNNTSEETSISDYQEVGPINVYNYVSGYDDGDFMNVEKNTLYVKTFRGADFFYVSLKNYDGEKFPVEKGAFEEGGEWFNGRIDTGELVVYVNIPLWGEVNRKTSKKGELDNEEKETRRIVVEHHRDLQPIQEWVSCYMCGGSGNCHLCNGTGRNLYSSDYQTCTACAGNRRCTSCAGQGGHYETRYR